ncbi:hypothetical protein [Chitinivorax sp. B]|uniref:hypothetical protein n=1 Tax=Chitinivorax sp. B TaxID=2502235 RepID=UPI0010F60DFB|nr:hypothetical protein [Chitinivorax sp. B]
MTQQHRWAHPMGRVRHRATWGSSIDPAPESVSGLDQASAQGKASVDRRANLVLGICPVQGSVLVSDPDQG